jgi:hypothetical protein
VYPNQGQEWDVSDISLAGGTGDIEGTKAWLTPEGKIVPLTEQTHNMEAYAIIHGESPKELLDRAVERFEEEIRERLEADGEELYPVVYVEGAGEIEVIVEDSYSSREVTDLTETEEQLLEKVSEASVLAYDRENIDSYEVLLSAGWAAIKQPRDEINVTTARPLNGPQRRNVTDFAIFHDLEIVEDVYGSVHPQAILRDESGNVIPLSERFNPESNSILFAERQAEAGDEPLFSVKSSQFVPNDELENLDAKKLRQQVYVRGLGDKDGLDLLAGGDRETLSRERLLEIIRSQPSVTRGDLNSKAHARFDMDYDELNRSQKDSVLRYVLSGYGSESIPQKMQELVDKGVDIAKNIVNTLESQPKDFHARSRGSGGPQSSSRLQRTKNEALIATKNWYSKFRDGIITGKLTDLHTIIDALTDGNPDHPLWTIKRIINAGVRRKHMRDRYMKTWLTENGYDKLNIPWKQRFDIGDPRHPNGTRLHDVLGIYAIVADTPTGKGIAPVQQIEVQTDKNTGKKGVFLKGTDNFRGNATALFLSNRDLSYGATLEEQVKNFNEMLRNTYDVVKGSEQARGFIKLVRNYSEKALGDINAVRESLGIDPIEGRQNYLLPMMREGGTFRVDDLLYEAMELSPSRESAGRNPTPFFKRRTEGARARPIYLNASDVFNRYQKQVDTYIAKKPTVMLSQVILKELENSGWFQDNEELGALETLYAIAEREKYWNGRADPTTYIDGVLGQLRGNTFRATLTGNLPSGLRQGVSFWDAMALLPASQVFEGVKQYVRMFGKIGQVMAQSGGDTSLLINPLESDIAYKTAEQLGSRHIHAFWQISAQDIISEGGSQGVWSKKIGAMSLQDWAGSMQRWHDSTTRMAIWWTAYQYKLNKEGATQEEAFRYAEDLTLRTQPAADISERVGLQTGPEWQRTLAMYQSQLLKRTQLYRTEIIRPMMREWNKGTDPIDSIMRVSDALLTGRAIPDGHGPIAKRFFFMSVMPSIALGMIMRGGPPKDWKQFANDMLMFNITAIPILGPLVSFKMMYGVFEESGAQVYYNFMNDVGKFIVQAMPGGEEMTVEDWVSDPLRFTQYIGFPKTIVRPALDWIRGEEMPEGITEIFSRYGFRFVDDDGEPLMAREQWEKFWDNVGALGD